MRACLTGLAFALLVLAASIVPALAQGGAAGGVIGKQGKSVSGGEEVQPAPPRKRTNAAAAPADPNPSPRSRCPNIVGVWNSWASGLFGKSDATFHSDGTSIHRSGIAGKWWCESGQLRMAWGGEAAKTFRLSDDRRQIIEIASGAVGFSRN